MCVCVRETERERERMCVCMYEREWWRDCVREGESVCVCETERERERVCVHACSTERVRILPSLGVFPPPPRRSWATKSYLRFLHCVSWSATLPAPALMNPLSPGLTSQSDPATVAAATCTCAPLTDTEADTRL